MKTELFWRISIIAILVGLAALVGIGMFVGDLPSERAVARAFERKHSGWLVDSVTRGRGDNDGCEYVIAFRTSPSDPIQHGIWSVYSAGMLGWDVQGEELSPPGTNTHIP